MGRYGCKMCGEGTARGAIPKKIPQEGKKWISQGVIS